ncbi:hypothetical protein [Pseudonocardia broussonetiae]|uniref:Uncharacterized protein n=1 Tax=Pseudonocardia broussonetiae TaxID=2736640 RepID=A0A6M6JJM6_9PSEU|nr:hypothetical protein [Pseudonocardia broussonetiae]QJY46629.1 hypothetical protein HOP40_13055 [Pseudonocardia broussonetiae]
MDRTDPPLRWNTFTEVLSFMPDVYARMLAEHRPAANGRCRSCTQPGTGVPHAPWPCSAHNLAAAAQRIDTARERAARQRRERAG